VLGVPSDPFLPPDDAETDPSMPGYIPFYVPKKIPESIPETIEKQINQNQLNEIARYLLPNGDCVEMDCYPDCEFPRC
jgi:hypothetical protein